ncbi:hypothetical protein RD792_017326 [Penstemon davidsonii]|uniref:Peroxisomal adenine nucleotide carrier 1 n=1 Tax=Penstemon davidsonii TaxID=160366 RepID=A0ABR0CNH8_9LAMI|nr:hypothetical protein RD792_017326 [Penstemon davidsonii]
MESLVEATSGAVGSLVSTTILYPLDTCKTKYQAENRAHNHQRYRNISDVLWEAISTRQVLSLYQGLGTKNFQSFISQFVYFYGYSFFKRLYLKESGYKSIGTKSNLPLDTASSKMQTSDFGKSKGLWESLSESTWTESFDGLGISLLLTANPSIQYTAFDQLKQRLLKKKNSKKKGDVSSSSPEALSAFSAFVLGAVSKCIATCLTYPAIRCKVMIQSAESDENENDKDQAKSRKTISGALFAIWEKEGILGFFKGLQAQILKTVLSSALLLMIKEKITKTTWVLFLAIRKFMLITRTRNGYMLWHLEMGWGFGDMESLVEAASGAVGALVSNTILYPLDTCKTKYQAENRAHHQKRYRNISDVLWEAISKGQVLSLYQGLGTKNLQSFISQFVYFYGYSFFKRLYLRESGYKSIGTKANLVIAAAAASSRMQTSEFGKSKGLLESLSEGTWTDAFDGLGISLLLTTNPSIQYTVFDQLKQRLLNEKMKKNTDKVSSSEALSAFSAFMLGAVSKCIATCLTYPAIRCKVMIQSAKSDENEEDRPQSKSRKRTVSETLNSIWENEGLPGFFKGLQAQILKTVLSSALLLMIKEKITKSTWVLLIAVRRFMLATKPRLKST